MLFIIIQKHLALRSLKVTNTINYRINNDKTVLVIAIGLKDKDVIKISSHIEGKHFLALTKENLVYSWGNGDNGRLGN